MELTHAAKIAIAVLVTLAVFFLFWLLWQLRRKCNSLARIPEPGSGAASSQQRRDGRGLRPGGLR